MRTPAEVTELTDLNRILLILARSKDFPAARHAMDMILLRPSIS
jgi:hypothetical protein